MKLSAIKPHIPFKAHTYKVEPARNLLTVQTDNNPYMGEKPEIYSKDFLYNKSEAMEKRGNLYSTDIFAKYGDDIRYCIIYQDTGKQDTKNGKNYKVNAKFLIRKANEFLRTLYKQPMVHTIKSGSATGRLIYAENTTFTDMNSLKRILDNVKEPTILVTNRYVLVPDNPNILGIIYTNDDVATFSHFATQLRNGLDICATVYDTNLISELEKLNGQRVEIDLKDDSINIKKSNKLSPKKHFPKIQVPEMKYCSKPLKAEECSSDLIGAKAVNLARLEKLSSSGKIDCIIPRFIALPTGYIENLLSGNTSKYGEYQEQDKGNIEALKKFIKTNGINAPAIMVRSSFNGEDLPHYPAAGLYDSSIVYKEKGKEEIPNASLYNTIREVAISKNKKTTIKTNAKYGINNDDIKPGIVIQNKVYADYTFTLYSDDGKGNIIIDLFSNSGYLADIVQPHTFLYNKKTGELKYDSIELLPTSVTFSEDGEIIDCSKMPVDLSKNNEVISLVKKLCKNVITIEKEFGVPQDIEGGFKDNDVYLWQTRNIVR